MKPRVFTVLSGIILSLTMVFGFLPACADGNPGSPSSNPSLLSNTPSSGQERQSDVFNWYFANYALIGTPTYWIEEEFAYEVKKASGGRLNLDMQSAGAGVGYLDVFDAIASGRVKIGSTVDYYWQAKDPRFNLSGIVPASFTWEQAACYYYCDSTNGRKDTDAVFEKFGIKRIVKNIAEPDVAVMSRDKRIAETRDFKGLTIRGGRNIPLIMQEPEFGASGVNMATADVYTSLQTKVIDACTVGNAFSNWGSGYHEVTKYWSFPGMQRTQVTSLIINLEAWKSLPEDIQEILKMACSHTLLRSWSYNHVKNAEIIPVLQQKHGIEIVRLSPDCQQTWKTVSWRLTDNYAANDPEFKKMWENQKALINILAPYEELQRVTYTTGK